MRKKGFSLVELVIAIGIALMCSVLAFQALRSGFKVLNMAHTTQYTQDSLDEFAARLEREAASSDAVWISQKNGNNVLNFSLVDGGGVVEHWSYTFTTQLQRTDEATGTTSNVTGTQAITSVLFQSLPVSEISNNTNVSATFFNQIPVADDVAYTIDANGIAGNHICVVTLQAGSETRVVHLLVAASAEGFGVERGVFWHSIVWRETTTRRFLFGLGQKTNYDIWAEVAYTTDNWNTSHVWCSYDVYGALDVSDPRAQQNYHDSAESANSIFAACQKQTGQNAVPVTVPATSARTLE